MSTPNVLYILADDLGWGDVSCHGSPIRTPNIDRLVQGGVELTQHYVCPMCTPTRTSLLTGRHPGRFGPHATVPLQRARPPRRLPYPRDRAARRGLRHGPVRQMAPRFGTAIRPAGLRLQHRLRQFGRRR